MIELANDLIEVGISELGAELEYIKINGENILWKRSELWNEQSPVLFPIIGCLKDGYYSYNGKKYTLPPHGFARKYIFKEALRDKNRVILELTYNEETYMVYPFKFKLLAILTLDDSSISMDYKIENLDDKIIPVSIGIHPGFSYSGINRLLGNVRLDGHNKEVKEVLFDPTYITKAVDNSFSFDSLEELSRELVEKRTLCYKGLNDISLIGSKHSIRISHSMDFTAFWQKNPEGGMEFMCIEGWDGIPDLNNSDHNILNKRGTHFINTSDSYYTSFKISYK